LRRPSARLERRIFADGPAAMEGLPPLRLNWLAPALAALVLMGVLVNERCGPALSASASSGPLVAMILSNQSAAAYLPGSIQAERNNLPADTFGSPSARGASARLSSISPAKAND
jgi:hypothetical protein